MFQAVESQTTYTTCRTRTHARSQTDQHHYVTPVQLHERDSPVEEIVFTTPHIPRSRPHELDYSTTSIPRSCPLNHYTANEPKSRSYQSDYMYSTAKKSRSKLPDEQIPDVTRCVTTPIESPEQVTSYDQVISQDQTPSYNETPLVSEDRVYCGEPEAAERVDDDSTIQERVSPADFSQSFAVTHSDKIEERTQTVYQNEDGEFHENKKDALFNVMESDMERLVSGKTKQRSKHLVQLNNSQSSVASVKKKHSPNILTRKRPTQRECPAHVGHPTDQQSGKELDIYEFDEEETTVDQKSRSGKRKHLKSEDDLCPFLRAKQRRSSIEGVESIPVSTGSALKLFMANHPLLLGLYMNKGKRQVKRNLVSMKRDAYAIDKGSWTRGSKVMTRNRLDDHFELTPEGVARLEAVNRKEVRDERVVCWYMWCPGHGNCLRQCQGYGKCVDG